MGYPENWPLADLVATGDLAREYGVRTATIANWPVRYPDFPAPLTTLSSGPVYSRKLVREWHDGREWKPGKHRS